MFTDANGEVHFEFWEGIKMDGRVFKSVPLYNLSMEFGDGQIVGACRHLGCYPYAADLAAIKQECIRQEELYV